MPQQPKEGQMYLPLYVRLLRSLTVCSRKTLVCSEQTEHAPVDKSFKNGLT